MAYISLCKHKNLMEGEIASFSLDQGEIMLVWPDGGELKAFQGTCPHQDIPMWHSFNGRILACQHHNWVFDGRSGKGLSPTGCQLEEFSLRIVDGYVEVELEN
ncbi:MAG TPA: Rieske 2Fe-2S domain-containing protein [Methylophilaceae bacterium]|jgi:toluene monooxygenase system ferredoxin subunit